MPEKVLLYVISITEVLNLKFAEFAYFVYVYENVSR